MDKSSGQLATLTGSALASVDETTGLVTLKDLPITGQEQEKASVDSVFNGQITVRAVSLRLSSPPSSTTPTEGTKKPAPVEVNLTFSTQKSGDTEFSPVRDSTGQQKVYIIRSKIIPYSSRQKSDISPRLHFPRSETFLNRS